MICKECSTEFEDTDVCPNCGWSPDSETDDIKDIDNSSEIDRMFAAVKQQVGNADNADDAEIAERVADELGETIPGKEEKNISDEEDGETEKTEKNDSSPKATAKTSANVAKTNGEISQEQIQAFMSGEPIEFVPDDSDPDGENGAERPKRPAQPAQEPPPDLDDIDLLGKPEDFDADAAAKGGGAKANDDDDDSENEQDVQTVPAKRKSGGFVSTLLRVVFTALAVIVAGVLGIAGCLLFIVNMFSDGLQGIGYNAARTIDDLIPEDSRLIIYDMYIKTTSAEYQCVVYCGIEAEIGNIENTHYRIVFEKETGTDPTVYEAFDEEEYNRLYAGSGADRILADVMKTHDDAYQKAYADIAAGKSAWVRVDENMINYKMRHDKIEEEKQGTTRPKTTVAAETSAPAASSDDIADIE